MQAEQSGMRTRFGHARRAHARHQTVFLSGLKFSLAHTTTFFAQCVMCVVCDAGGIRIAITSLDPLLHARLPGG